MIKFRKTYLNHLYTVMRLCFSSGGHVNRRQMWENIQQFPFIDGTNKLPMAVQQNTEILFFEFWQKSKSVTKMAIIILESKIPTKEKFIKNVNIRKSWFKSMYSKKLHFSHIICYIYNLHGSNTSFNQSVLSRSVGLFFLHFSISFFLITLFFFNNMDMCY